METKKIEGEKLVCCCAYWWACSQNSIFFWAWEHFFRKTSTFCHTASQLRIYIIWFSELPNRYSGFKNTSRRNRSFGTLSVHRLLLMLTYETMIMHVTHKIIMYSTCKLIHPVLTLYGRLMRRRLTAGRRFVCRTFFPADTEIFGAKKYIFLWRKTTSTQMDREKTNVKQTLVDSRFSRRSGAQIGIAIVSMVHKQQ